MTDENSSFNSRHNFRNNPDEGPEKSLLLNLLDAEISLSSQQQSHTGWTSWALTGAIGAVFWALLNQWEKAWPSGNLWISAYVALWLCFASLRGLPFIFNPASFGLSDTASFGLATRTRFQLGFSFTKQRSLTLFTIIHSSILLSLIISFPVPLIAKIWSGVTIGLVIALFLYIFAISYTQNPIPAQSGLDTKTWHSLAANLLIIAIFSTPAILLAMDLFSKNPSALDLKVAALLVTAVFLVQKGLEEQSDRSSIGNLLRIRRELALGTLPAKDAAGYLEIEFLGMQVSDVFRESAQQFLLDTNTTSNKYHGLTNRLDAILASIAEDSPLSADQQSGIAHTVIEAYQSWITMLTEDRKTLSESYQEIESRSHFFLNSSTDAKTAMQGIMLSIQTSHTDALSSTDAFQQKLERLIILAKTITANEMA
ncbi:hypothetical protein [Stigmatella erecta]|uniref:Uncharacterized protein n=1 Tax=Stigmatella erecta TaxID=83460 RepID=A0A1I0JE48_9BACT|nr:hypothetical protein [Stigmatella erecta]SEU08388.1 hypothetical protein SAMN05443639_107193 [Stigmatella erecta]